MPTAAIPVKVNLSPNGFLHSKAEVRTTRLCTLFDKTLSCEPKKCLKWSYHGIMYYEFQNKLSTTECQKNMCESFNTVWYNTVKV